MRTHGRMVSDDALTRTLDQWLADGPREMPEEVLADALRSVASTSQRRFRGWFLRMTGASSPAVPVGLTVVGITAVVAVALGLGLRNVAPPPGESSPTALPHETGSPAPEVPEGMQLYVNEEIGFSVVIPEDWDSYPLSSDLEDAPGVVGFGSSEGMDPNDPAMYVSIGGLDGSVFVCNRGRICDELAATTLAQLGAQVEGIAPPGLTIPVHPNPMTRDVDLDGESAQYEGYRACNCGSLTPWLQHVLTFHDGRPVILGFDHYTFSTPLSFAERQIIESFRFIDPTASETPEGTPEPDARGSAVTAAGLHLTLPPGWGRCSSETGAQVFRATGDCRFGTQHTDTSGGLTPFISIRLGAAGDPPTYCTGSICPYSTGAGCNTSGVVVPEIACEDHPIRTLAGLWSYVRPSGYVPNGLQETDIEIDGSTARLVTATRTFLEGRIVFEKTWLLVLRDRPYVLQLSAAQGAMPGNWIDDVIASMSFSN